MNRTLSTLLLALAVFAGGLLAACDSSEESDPEREFPEEFPDGEIVEADGALAYVGDDPYVVAVGNARSGEIDVLEDRLRKTFADGGPIDRFEVVKLDGIYHLLRIGENAQGTCSTESYQLVQHRGVFSLDHKVKWYTTCFSPNCRADTDGDGRADQTGFCYPNSTRTNCECSFGGNCIFGVAPLDIEVVIIW